MQLICVSNWSLFPNSLRIEFTTRTRKFVIRSVHNQDESKRLQVPIENFVRFKFTIVFCDKFPGSIHYTVCEANISNLEFFLKSYFSSIGRFTKRFRWKRNERPFSCAITISNTWYKWIAMNFDDKLQFTCQPVWKKNHWIWIVFKY